MSPEKTTLEIIAPSVDEAITRGLAQFGLPADAVDVEVLDSGSKGLFGLGGRQARVRLSIKSTMEIQPERKVEQPVAEKPVEKPAVTPRPETNHKGNPVEEHGLEVAQEVVGVLLEKMKVHAKVTTRFVENEENKNEPMIMVEINGDDLSILIGRRSETLNALQYISNLIVCKELGQWVPLMIDVQGYRSRRERQLRQLAHRMADQAIHTGRRQVLEPMPANERRLIHLELRDHELVTTESVGDEPNRKVTIYVKKQK